MKKIMILICGTLLMSGCDDFLNVKPKGQAIPEYYNDYKGLLYDAQMAKAGESYPVTLTDDAHFPDGDIPYNLEMNTEDIRNLYKFNHGPVYNQGESDGLWEFTYQRIYTCNAVINNIMDVSNASEEEKRTLRAEAMVARAFEYLCLIAAYAPAYDPATAATDPGVPIITTESADKLTGYTRNTVAEVYEFIENDLLAAEGPLKTTAPNSFYPTKSVAFGFFARMCLMMRDYDKALEFGQDALDQNSSLVDLTLYAIDPDNPGIGRIVLASNPTVSYPEDNDNPENIYTRFAPYVFGMSMSVYASDDLLEVYKEDLPAGAEDMRRSLWFVDDSHPWMGEFPGLTLWVPFTYANLGLNTVENLLTTAECYARKGDAASLSKAAELYNRLRDNRIKGNVHVTFANKAEAVQKVLRERRREFAMTGLYRFTDLKRLNKEAEYAKTIVHTSGTQTWTLPPNDNRYILPIPPKVKALRPDLPDYER